MQGTPDKTELRKPTPAWSGYGFSESSPTTMLQNNKKEENILVRIEYFKNFSRVKLVSLLLYCVLQNTKEEIHTPTKNYFNDSMESKDNNFSASNYLDVASTTFNVVTSSNYTDLPTQLASLGLQKYIRKHFSNITSLRNCLHS